MLNRFWKRNNTDNKMGFENDYFQREYAKLREEHQNIFKLLDDIHSQRTPEIPSVITDFSEYKKIEGFEKTYYKVYPDYDLYGNPHYDNLDINGDLKSVKEYLGKITYRVSENKIVVSVPDELNQLAPMEESECYLDKNDNLVIVRLFYRNLDIKKVIMISDKSIEDAEIKFI